MKSRATLTTGTAKELAEKGEGFAANGESMWTRRAAHPDAVRMNGYVKPKHRTGTRTRATDIHWNEVEIERMQRAMTVEKNPANLAKLAKNIAIKSAFVERLKGEREHEKIETIHGADEFERWDKV